MRDKHSSEISGSVGDAEKTAQLPLISDKPLKANQDNQGEYIGSDFEEDDEWPSRTASRGVRVPLPVVILLVILVGFGGIWGGAALQRNQNTSDSSGIASAFARFRSGATSSSKSSGFSGFGGFAGGAQAGSAASGTVTVIDGNTLYITDASGGIVKVIMSNSTKVTRDAPTTPSALQPGDTVTIQGSKTSNGTVNATSISATASN